MWPFIRPKKTLKEIEIERFPELVDAVAKKWPKYLQEMEKSGFSDPPLDYQFLTFGINAAKALRQANYALRLSEDGYFYMAVAVGMLKSGLFTQQQIEAAIGREIPLSIVTVGLFGGAGISRLEEFDKL